MGLRELVEQGECRQVAPPNRDCLRHLGCTEPSSTDAGFLVEASPVAGSGPPVRRSYCCGGPGQVSARGDAAAACTQQGQFDILWTRVCSSP